LKGIVVTLVNPELGPNMILMTSSSGNVSYIVDDQNQQGVFTYHLLKRLQEAKSEISIDALFNLLRKDVALTTIKKLNKIQTPSIFIRKDIDQKVKMMLLSGSKELIDFLKITDRKASMFCHKVFVFFLFAEF
jgi:hypothetical protein